MRRHEPRAEDDGAIPDELGCELVVRFPGDLGLWRRNGRYALSQPSEDGAPKVDLDLDWAEAKQRIRKALGRAHAHGSGG